MIEKYYYLVFEIQTFHYLFYFSYMAILLSDGNRNFHVSVGLLYTVYEMVLKLCIHFSAQDMQKMKECVLYKFQMIKIKYCYESICFNKTVTFLW